MDAPDELRQAVADAILHAQPTESRFYAADAVLSVPGIADALAAVAQRDEMAEQLAYLGAGCLDATREELIQRITAIGPENWKRGYWLGRRLDAAAALGARAARDEVADALARDAKVAEIVAEWRGSGKDPWPMTRALEHTCAIAALYPEAGK